MMRHAKPLAAALLGLTALAAPADAQPGPAGAADQGRQWALLIGVEKYEKARPLVFTINDVKALSKTLRERNGVDAAGLLAITDDAEDPRRRPTRANLLEAIPRWLAQVGPKDRLLVYFSGHGFRDPAGRLYLAPIDVDPSDPAATGLPVEWFRRQVADCKADFKLLVLDACHAGSEKGEEGVRDVPSKEIGDLFKGLERVVTLASSTGEESSQIWEAKEQSLYSYWLNQALKGHADADADGAVDIDELNRYVYRNVVRTSEAHFPRKQTPVRSVRTGVEGTPVVVRVKPGDLKTLLNDIAEQITLAAEDRQLKKVGVLEFAGDSGGLGELLGAQYGTLGRWCAEWLERRLMEEGEGRFAVTNGKVLQASLARQNFGLDDLAKPDRLRELSRSLNGLPALAQGALRSRAGRVVTLQCRLIQTEADELAGSAGGVALLNESEWAMLGKSAALTPADRMPAPPSLDDPTPRVDPQTAAVARLEQKADGPHPMTDPNFELPVRIYVGGKERPGTARGNQWIVPLRKGETYEIYVENRTGQPVCMRLLVDGLNTLPDLEMARTRGIATFVWGQHVNLADARSWTLDPAKLRTPKKVWRISGFVTQTGPGGKLREFLVGAADQSLAAKRKFTEQIGLITAAFYDPTPRSRAVGTLAGKERTEDLRENDEYLPGPLRAVVHIRYVDADDPKAAESLEPPKAPQASGPRP